MGDPAATGAKGGRGYIMRAAERSLRRLRTDYIDLYQIHTPDPVTPDLRDPGRAQRPGHPGQGPLPRALELRRLAYRRGRHAVARELGTGGFVSAQNHWSLLERGAESELVPAARHFGLGVLPFFPLANGLLTGKVRRGQARPGAAGWPSGPTTSPRTSWTGSRRWRAGRAAARGDDPGRGHRRAGRPAGLRLGHRRGDVAGAGQGERGGRRAGSRRRPSSRSSTRSCPRLPSCPRSLSGKGRPART